MTVPDANDVSGATDKDSSRCSPILHIAIHNLLRGLKSQADVEVTVAYGKAQPASGEDRWEGHVHYVPVPYKRIPMPGMGGAYLSRARALLKQIKGCKPDIVHGQGNERESGLVAALSRRPSVLTLHGNFREISVTMRSKPFSYFWLCARIEEFILPRVNGVHCLSSHTQKSVEHRTPRTWIIPNAVDQRFFDVVRRPSPHPYIVCAAGIAEWKNPMHLILAGDGMIKQWPETEIHFFGACNPEHPYGKAFMDAIAQRPWCHYHGYSTTDVILEHFRVATCAVLPSKQENFGLALAEALASGIPGLGSNIGGIPDVIRNGETGFLFDPGNVDELAELLNSLHRDRSRMNEISSMGKLDAIQRFSCKAVADAHVKMYRDIIAPSPGTHA